MPTSINFDKKLGFINGTSIVLPSGSGADFSTRSLSFDGIDDYVEVADADNLSFGNGATDSPFSISAWIKIGQTTAQGIVTKYGSTNATREWLFYTTGAKLRLLFIDASNGANNFATGTTNLSINTWYHVACTYDGRGGSTAYNGMTLYINGVAESVTTSGGSYTAMSNTTQVVEIGKYSTNELLGNIDEVAVFNSELSASDVVSIYNNGKPADLTSLNPLAWYRAGENSTFAYPQILMPEDTNKDKVSKYSFVFDGLSYVDCGDPDEFSFSNGKVDSRFSLSAWVYMDDATQFRIASKMLTNATAEYAFFTSAADQLNFVLYTNNTSNRISRYTSATLTSYEGQWIHLAATYDGSGSSTGLKIYLNGNRVDDTTSNVGVYAAMLNTNAPLTIGRAFQSNANGKIDEAAVFPVELTQSNVQAIYNSGIPTDISSYSPVGYWKLGEEAKFTNNWLVPNSALSNFSKYSFNFDGLDDYIDCGNSASLQITGALTLSAWVKTSYSADRQIIIGKDGINTGQRSYLLNIATSGIPAFYIFTSSGQKDVQGLTTINDGFWHHIMVVNDGTDLKIYIDGTLNNTSIGSGDTMLNGNINFNIGRRQASSVNADYFNGNIDEVAVWNSDQSSNITSIFNQGEPTSLDSLNPISHWRMGEEATYDGTLNQFTIPDQGSGGNNGTSSNTMLLETLVGDTPQYYGGGISDSMDIFDRVGDAPNSENNTVSFNMEEADIVEDTP